MYAIKNQKEGHIICLCETIEEAKRRIRSWEKCDKHFKCYEKNTYKIIKNYKK